MSELDSLPPNFLEEVPVAMVRLTREGALQWANPPARQLLDGPGGPELFRTLRQMAERASPDPAGCVEAALTVRPLGDLRVVLERTPRGDGYYGLLEHNLLSRVRAESNVLRAMLSAAAAALPAAEAAARTLSTLASALPGIHLVLYELSPDGRELRHAASAGPISGDRRWRPQPLDGSTSLVACAVAAQSPLHLINAADSAFPPEGLPVEGRWAALALPVNGHGVTSGCLYVLGPSDQLGQDELRLLQGLADALGGLLEHARKEAAIVRERRALRLLLDNLPDAVIEQGPEGKITLAGGRVLPILGYSAEQLEGRSLVELIAPESRPAFARFLSSLRMGKPAAAEFGALHADGRVVPCNVAAHVAEGEGSGGQSRVLRAMFRDLSVRKALEEEVRRAAGVAAEKDRLAAIGQLTAGVAHELNNPLAYLGSNLRTMGAAVRRALAAAGPKLEGPAREGLEECEEIVRESLEGVEHVTGLVHALKGAAAHRPDERVRFDPSRSINQAVTIFAGAKRGDCQVECELPKLPEVIGSPSGLSQVVLNLLDNGLDAMSGHGTL